MSKTLLKCSFCRKSQDEVKKLIAGVDVYMCNECVELCNGILREEGVEPFAKEETQSSDICGQLETPAEKCKRLLEAGHVVRMDRYYVDTFLKGRRLFSRELLPESKGLIKPCIHTMEKLCSLADKTLKDLGPYVEPVPRVFKTSAEALDAWQAGLKLVVCDQTGKEIGDLGHLANKKVVYSFLAGAITIGAVVREVGEPVSSETKSKTLTLDNWKEILPRAKKISIMAVTSDCRATYERRRFGGWTVDGERRVVSALSIGQRIDVTWDDGSTWRNY